MKRNCPTVQELLAFDAVARHQSLTRAAAALCISVSGVSKQLAGLEQFIGRPLLQKMGRGVQLTTSGRAYWLKIAPSLRNLEEATFEARSGRAGGGIITLASVPTFLTKWLIPRLADFRRLQPSATFSFRQHLAPGDDNPPDVDASIRYGAGDWPGVQSDYIAGKAFVCIHSPSLLTTAAPSIDAAAVAAQVLLHHEQAALAWRLWALSHGLAESCTLAGPTFAQYSAVIQAVVSGLGVGLVPRVLVEDELQQGVVQAFGPPLEVDHGHYLCFQPERLERPVVAAFRDWLLEQGKPASASAPV